MAESKLRQRRFHGFGNTGDRMMRELGRTLVAFAVAVGIMPMMASSSREALPVSEGQPHLLLIKRKYVLQKEVYLI